VVFVESLPNTSFGVIQNGVAASVSGLAPVSWRGEVLGSGYLS
jgi:hypothetical protein